MRLLKRSWIALLIMPTALLVSAASVHKDADQIRERRLAYAEAMRARNPDRMHDFLAQDIVQLSSNGETMIGRDAVLRSYSKHEFLDPSFVVYERLPDTIDISENGRIAIERGHWRGRFHNGGAITGNSGLYQAGWVKRDGVWLIRTESYVRLHCANEKDCPS
jgi:ketosteroid isomerase-like protein